MPWPTGQDYNEAIQSPQSVFSDGDLRGGRAETNQHGFPRPRAGAFATVYRIENGSRAWAVRCFNRDTPDLQERYAAISDFLKRQALPYFANFEYLPQGIRVKGSWYPVLKMEWLRGEPLNVYIEKHLADSTALFKLASEWLQMAKAFSNAGIAHGDLQHGNVLLVGSQLKLIDYDGMYVPALNGKHSNETGQPNYQLPTRTALDFGPQLDNFSEWVVLVSILALCSEPTLWKTFRGGDECLLFRKSDFDNPAASQLFRTLESSKDQQVAALVSLFRTYVGLSPNTVPALDGSYVQSTAASSTASPASGQSDWLKDHIGPAVAPPVKSEPPEQVFAGDWLLDFTNPPGASVHFEGSFLKERLVVWIPFVTTVLFARLWLSVASVTVDAAMWLAAFLLLRHFYVGRPETSMLGDLRERLSRVKGELAEAKTNRDRSDRRCEDFRNVLAEKKNQSVAARVKLREEEKDKVASATQRHQAAKKALTDRLNNLNAQEMSDLAAIQKNLGATLAQRRSELVTLDQNEAKERSTLLKQRCDLHMATTLSNASLAEAAIPGIGPSLKKELWRSGIRSAKQVSRSSVLNVKGIGSAKADALVAWRMVVEHQAQNTMPTLTPQEQQTITDKYKTLRKNLQEEISTREKVVESEQRSVRSRYSASKDALTVQIRDADAASFAELQMIGAEFKVRYTEFDRATQRAESEGSRELSVLEAQLGDSTRQVTGIQWRMGKVDRERKMFDDVTFKAFLRRTLLWR